MLFSRQLKSFLLFFLSFNQDFCFTVCTYLVEPYLKTKPYFTLTDLKCFSLPLPQINVEILLSHCLLCVCRFGENDSDISLETQLSSADDYKDIYSLHVIPENKDGIQGSCNFFKERKDITKQIRSVSLTPLVSLEEASKKFVQTVYLILFSIINFMLFWGAMIVFQLLLIAICHCFDHKF